MTFNEYQYKAKQTLRINNNTEELEIARLTLGLTGESGEVAEKVKKFLRDTDMSSKSKIELSKIIRKELGDVLWYLAVLAYKFNIDLDYIARENIHKLRVRKEKNKIIGSGDER